MSKRDRSNLAALAALMMATGVLEANPRDAQRAFATPQEAVQATIDAAERNDTAALLRIFGPDGKDMVESGDVAKDKALRAEFARAANEKLELKLDPLQPDRVAVLVGSDAWHFPIPVVRKDGMWLLDPQSGKLEILARIIAGNESNAVEVCRGYAEAQIEYVSNERDGDHVLKYAQSIFSTPGRHDGLYSEGTPESLVSRAFGQASVAGLSPESQSPGPYRGYYFRVLKSQGKDAVGGALEYVVNGKMTGGFAMVATPVEYGASGIRTFVINQDGIVYEKDLGATTDMRARQMVRFNPDKSWREVVLE
jgi:hypothetical protein